MYIALGVYTEYAGAYVICGVDWCARMWARDSDFRHIGDSCFFLRSTPDHDRHVRAHRARPASSAAWTAKYDRQPAWSVRQGTESSGVAGRQSADLEHDDQFGYTNPSRDAIHVDHQWLGVGGRSSPPSPRRSPSPRLRPRPDEAAACRLLPSRVAAESSASGHADAGHWPRSTCRARPRYSLCRVRTVLLAVLRRLHRARNLPELSTLHLTADHHSVRMAPVQRLHAESDRLSHLQPGLSTSVPQDSPLSIIRLRTIRQMRRRLYDTTEN